MSTPGIPRQVSANLLDPPPLDPFDPTTWLHWPLEDVQREPAHLDPGPVLILGGVGTGKTHTLLGRAVHLARSGVDAAEIVIIAPNARAAQDMRVRLFRVIGSDPDNVNLYVGTLHDYCLSRLLRPYAAAIPTLPEHFSVWTQGQSLAALAQIVNADPPDRTGKMGSVDLAQILDWISVNAHLGTEHRTPPPRDEWNGYAATYQREKQAQDSLDPTDLLVATRDALRENPVLREICTPFLPRHLLVDNFEDVSSVQYELIRLMTGPEESVCVAMDPNQSVRRCGSVWPDPYQRFTADHARATESLLVIHHRMATSIMQSWRQLAMHHEMTGLVDDHQKALRPESRRPETIAVDGTPQDQYRRIADDIKGLVDEKTFGPDDIAILARNRNSLLRIGPHLDAAGIPFTTIGDFAGPSDPDVQSLLAMLTLAVNPKNVWAFSKAGDHTLNRFHRNLNPRIVREVRNAARRRDTDLIEAAAHIRADLPPDSTAHDEMSHIIELYHELQRMMTTRGASVAAMLELVHHQLHRAAADREPPPPSDDITRMRTRAGDCDFNARQLLSHGAPDGEGEAPTDVRAALLDFLDIMANGNDFERLPPVSRGTLRQRRVSLATMHMSKGMGWPAVVIADVADHIVPDRDAHHALAMMELEQRLFYVAVTRAADWYTLYWARQRDDGTSAAPSRFVKMLLLE